MLEVIDIVRLVVAGGLSAAIFLAFWLGWVKTRNTSFRTCAWFFGLLPIGFVSLILIARITLATGVVHEFQTATSGPSPGEGVVLRDLTFPVEDSELKHIIEVRPQITEIQLKNGVGENVAFKTAGSSGLVQVEYDAIGEGTYHLLLKIPEGVKEVMVSCKEIR